MKNSRKTSFLSFRRIVGLSWVIALSLSPLYAKNNEKKGNIQIEYEVAFKGVEDKNLVKDLKQTSDLENFKDKSPISVAALKHRAEADNTLLLEAMHAYGYYEACINTSISFLRHMNAHPVSFAYNAHPISKYGHSKDTIIINKYKVLIDLKPGPDYILSTFKIVPKEETVHDNFGKLFDFDTFDLNKLGIHPGAPINYRSVADAKENLIKKMRNKGFPLARITNQEILVDQAKKSVYVTLDVTSGPQARFGNVVITGLKNVSEKYAQNRVSWKKGELYRPKELDITQKSFFDSGLFTTVSITPGSHVDTNGYITMYITVTEGKHHTITLGGTYHLTWEGVGGIVGFKDRNLGHSGITFDINSSINQKKQVGKLLFQVPDVLIPNQNFFVMGSLMRNRAPNYLEKNLDARAFIERHFNRYISMSIGLKFDLMQTGKTDANEHYTLLGSPFHFNFQTSDSLLLRNPYKGGWVNIKVIPYMSLTKSEPQFIKGKIAGATYFPLWPNRRLILAQSALFASLMGETRINIPAPYRFYAGNEQHLRGYPYQAVSPLDDLDRPIGGKSTFLYSLEIRMLVKKDFEMVGFLDIGNVWATSWPDWDNAMLKSMGFGLRYFTFIGPLRVDIGYPMNKRPNIKKSYQVYFSIGQPF